MSAKKASPVEIRKSLEAASLLARAGIRFVPVPAIDENDHEQLLQKMLDRLEKIEQTA